MEYPPPCLLSGRQVDARQQGAGAEAAFPGTWRVNSERLD